MIRVAAAAYPLEWHDTLTSLHAKLRRWLEDAAGKGAHIVVFPEYAAMELAPLAGPAVAGDLQASIDAVTERLPALDAWLAEQARALNLLICAGTAPVRDADGQARNRARLFAPNGQQATQDKLILTRYERETWQLSPGTNLSLFATPLGRIGVLTCYDAEFPQLARALIDAGAEILLVPSATEAASGYARVRIGAMARALESQCVSVLAPLVGEAAWSPAVDVSYGRAGLYGPPDSGFPADGILAESTLNAPGWVMADIDPAAIAHVRQNGQVLNWLHWREQDARLGSVDVVSFGER